MRRGPERLDEETICIDRFTSHLRLILKDTVTVQPGPPNRAPDYWLNVADRRFAVEVTSIVVQQTVALDDRCTKLARAIESTALERGVLCGTYPVTFFDAPDLPDPRTEQWKALVTSGVRFVEGTRQQSNSTAYILMKNRSGRVQIQKLGPENSGVLKAGPIVMKWGSEMREEVQLLLQNAITKKRFKLDKPHISPEKILLLYDAYGFATPSIAQGALLSVEGFEWFHSIFWVAPSWQPFTGTPPQKPPPVRQGCFLWTRDPLWMAIH